MPRKREKEITFKKKADRDNERVRVVIEAAKAGTYNWKAGIEGIADMIIKVHAIREAESDTTSSDRHNWNRNNELGSKRDLNHCPRRRGRYLFV